jgi:hypothetical protein
MAVNHGLPVELPDSLQNSGHAGINPYSCTGNIGRAMPFQRVEPFNAFEGMFDYFDVGILAMRFEPNQLLLFSVQYVFAISTEPI